MRWCTILPTGDTESVQSIGGQLDAATGDPIGNSVTGDPQMVSRTQLGMLDDEQNLQCQGLSLSLNTQMRSAVPGPSSQYQYSNPGLSSVLSHHLPISVEGTISWKGYGIPQSKELTNDECLPSGFTGGNHNGVKTESFCNPQCPVNPKGIHSDSYPYEPSGHTFTICNSKYFKAAQQLLDEVVNVLKALKRPVLDKHQNFHGIGLDVPKETDERSTGQSMLPSMNGISSVQNDTNSSCELSPAEQQDLEDKNTKLLSMLNEVDRRYNQYYHQMQILVSSFDMVAGSGAAKPYTALALQTISRHFRCLRDAISGQIQVTRRSLGEQDTSLNVQGGGIPRLRYVDRQLRQHRALQQLGVMRHAWRPQRGLPESSVSILRAWLFEHFLHPYPKDSDKIMLARQTGLTRSQVANWFINARVRLWKPMVEDMYKEEFGNLEINSKSSPENALKAPKDNFWASEDGGEELQESSTSTAAAGGPLGQFHESKSDLIPDVELKGSTASAGISEWCPWS
ncbi:hypothetical protein L1049_025387 [Liquidambar formosana]|uniref:Homeobox domain-containing protein n=1 Tax=Liquidambar formosana TaxID=63359 RepID=A0AAP0NEI8_LIQFO